MTCRRNKTGFVRWFALTLGVCVFTLPSAVQAKASIDFPVVKLRSLDNITARTEVFEANVGRTIKFGSVFIKVQACRKAPEMEKPEAAAFLQVWETPPSNDNQEPKPEWIFSGWMFASSPGLSAMDHPIYDVWVLDCLKTEEQRAQEVDQNQEDESKKGIEGEGVLSEEATPAEPAITE